MQRRNGHPVLISRPQQAISFLREFLERPKQVASVIPSSRFMERRITRNADLENCELVVELGPGTGGTTREVLAALPPQARLLAIDINSGFCELLTRSIDDPRLIVHQGCAAEIPQALAQYDLGAPDVVLSGIPFSMMPEDLNLAILRSVRESLRPGGRFIAYQFRDVVHTLGKQVFGPASVQFELMNLPPMRVYRWDVPAEPLPAD